MSAMRWWVALVLIGCGGGGGGGGGGGNSSPRLKASLDLTHVIGFAIADQTSMRDCMPSTLYALQDNGDMVVTTMTEVPGMGDAGVQCTTTMQTEMATGVFDTPKYDVVTYSLPGLNACAMAAGSAGCQPCPYVVLRKRDGALFCGTDGFDVRRVQGTGDVLYLGTNTFTRLDMSTDPPTSTTVDDTGTTHDLIHTFDVNNDNDALAGGNFGERVFKSNGGLANVGTTGGIFQWLDPGGADFFYSFITQPQVPPPNGLVTVRVSAGTYNQTVVGAFDQADLVNSGFALVTSTQAYAWVTGSTSAIVDLLPSAGGGVCRAISINTPLACTTDADCAATCVGTTNKICNGGVNNGLVCPDDAFCSVPCSLGGARHALTGVPVVKNAVGIGTQIYLQGTDSSGNGMIVGVDTTSIPETACCTTMNCCPSGCCSGAITPATLLAAGAYTVTAISLSKTGELTFAGLRNSDGAKVVGNCVGGTCTVLNTTAPSVTALQRIN